MTDEKEVNNNIVVRTVVRRSGGQNIAVCRTVLDL
jgi:hypothetical protein